ncbi:hypothetical protein AB0E70_33650 [Streptomyces murinus]|uniref:hypothetical protein n=1 Tax=Streptomyces murinus TaxID=33900 RepID=UPI000A386EEF|nr:hypothetical protein [Streptomyces murinus]
MTRYHYVITVEIPGLGVSTGNDSVTLNPGATRSQVYNHALSRAVANIGPRPGEQPARSRRRGTRAPCRSGGRGCPVRGTRAAGITSRQGVRAGRASPVR